MKKRVGLFLTALALATAALVSNPVTAKASLFCHPPACFIGPGCCTNAECDLFCQNLSPGSVPLCTDPNGGCCYCENLE